MPKKLWWEDGLRFQCQGSGKCCVSRGEYGFVYVTLDDRKKLAKYFSLSTAVFTKKYCDKEEGIWKLKDFTKACVFLEGKKCKVYEARPMQCKTWPFWPETLVSQKAWNREVTAYCPGVGKGPLRSATEIKKQLSNQESSEAKY